MSDSISNVTRNPEMFDPYDIAGSLSPERQPDNEELIPLELKEISDAVSSKFKNITLDPSITSDALRRSYVSSFVALEKPDSLNQQSQKQILSQLESLAIVTEGLLEAASDPAKVKLASQILADIQATLAEAQQLYDLYYAPGAIHADQIQGDRRVGNEYSTQEISNSLQTIQHVAGMALIQPSTQEDITENLEADSGGLISPGGDRVTQSRVIYEVGKLYFTELAATHLTNRNILPAIRVLLAEMGQFQRRGYQTQKDIAYRDQINAGPRAVRDEKVAQKRNSGLFPNPLSNIAATVAAAGRNLLAFANQISYRPTPTPSLQPSIENTALTSAAALANQLSPTKPVVAATNNIPLETNKLLLDNQFQSSLQESLKTIGLLIATRPARPINVSLT